MIPRLYAIADAQLLSSRGISLAHFASELRDAGVELLQYRDKRGSLQGVLNALDQLRTIFHGNACRVIANDRPDLALLAEVDGVHVGQHDLSPADARSIVGSHRIIGLSTHCVAQVKAAEQTCADYIAVGPAFATRTKPDHEPVVGLEGVRQARLLTAKPLVAIGGITRENARSVVEAGADSVAVVSAFMVSGEGISQVARDFLDILR
jgi:thiamine-phosphate pyrophosphorylase